MTGLSGGRRSLQWYCAHISCSVEYGQIRPYISFLGDIKTKNAEIFMCCCHDNVSHHFWTGTFFLSNIMHLVHSSVSQSFQDCFGVKQRRSFYDLCNAAFSMWPWLASTRGRIVPILRLSVALNTIFPRDFNISIRISLQRLGHVLSLNHLCMFFPNQPHLLTWNIFGFMNRNQLISFSYAYLDLQLALMSVFWNYLLCGATWHTFSQRTAICCRQEANPPLFWVFAKLSPSYFGYLSVM